MSEVANAGSPTPGDQLEDITVQALGLRIAVAICVLAVVELMLIVTHVVGCYVTGKCFQF